MLGGDVSGVRDEDAGLALADRLLHFMQTLGVPNGLKALGYTEDDVDALVEGTIPQERVTKLAPVPVGRPELAKLFKESLTLY
jgi:hydroxyacid-oxoacid transhydrogenase